MNRMKRGTAVLLLFGMAFAGWLGLTPGPSAGAKAKPGASELSAGYLLIGTYLIHRDSLTEDNLKAAKASVQQSGQGMYYKSEFADGAWFNIENATDIGSIMNGKGTKPVSNEAIDKLKLAVWIDESGNVSNLQSDAEIDKQIEALNKEKKSLQEDNEKAVEKNKTSDSAQTALQIKDVEARIAFLEALKQEDGRAAAGQMKKMANPAALLAELPKQLDETLNAGDKALQDERDKLAAALRQARDGGQADQAATLSAQLQQADAKLAQARLDAADTRLAALREQQAEQQRQLADALERGDRAAAEAAAQQLGALAAATAAAQDARQSALLASLAQRQAQAAAALAQAEAQRDGAAADRRRAELAQLEAQAGAVQRGLARELEAAREALQQLQDEHGEAVRKGDGEQAELLQPQVAAAAANVRKAEKAGLFFRKARYEEKLAAAKSGGAAAPAMEQLVSDTVTAIRQVEKSKYSKEELSALQDIAAAIEKNGEGMQSLPVESVISRDFDIRFEAPPVMAVGIALIPIRPIVTAFGASVVWDEQERSVTVLKEGTVVYCRIGDKTAFVNGSKAELERGPELIGERTYVPLRLVMEGLGLHVQWMENTKTIQIDAY
ncbi:stalk domain-containing protein [Paenibacillus hamazuiensis]|uniref:stalk domain-containing protein n=1 Tax=Paenibacillus hamazuiensis TaxID=2936508 RepID=UPI00200F3C61|nr:copper amine oxidase N-terminal domain-containing protein [Paenibacillus hamazuiensis]